jgi:hypothetical protein
VSHVHEMKFVVWSVQSVCVCVCLCVCVCVLGTVSNHPTLAPPRLSTEWDLDRGSGRADVEYVRGPGGMNRHGPFIFICFSINNIKKYS